MSEPLPGFDANVSGPAGGSSDALQDQPKTLLGVLCLLGLWVYRSSVRGLRRLLKMLTFRRFRRERPIVRTKHTRSNGKKSDASDKTVAVPNTDIGSFAVVELVPKPGLGDTSSSQEAPALDALGIDAGIWAVSTAKELAQELTQECPFLLERGVPRSSEVKEEVATTPVSRTLGSARPKRASSTEAQAAAQVVDLETGHAAESSSMAAQNAGAQEPHAKSSENVFRQPKIAPSSSSKVAAPVPTAEKVSAGVGKQHQQPSAGPELSLTRHSQGPQAIYPGAEGSSSYHITVTGLSGSNLAEELRRQMKAPNGTFPAAEASGRRLGQQHQVHSASFNVPQRSTPHAASMLHRQTSLNLHSLGASSPTGAPFTNNHASAALLTRTFSLDTGRPPLLRTLTEPAAAPANTPGAISGLSGSAFSDASTQGERTPEDSTVSLEACSG